MTCLFDTNRLSLLIISKTLHSVEMFNKMSMFSWNEIFLNVSSAGFPPSCSRGRSIIPLQWRHNGRDYVSRHRRIDCLLHRLFMRISKKTSKLRVTGLGEGNSPVTGEFPSQRASNAENVSIWWRHHALITGDRWLHSHGNGSLVPIVFYRIINQFSFCKVSHNFLGVSWKNITIIISWTNNMITNTILEGWGKTGGGRFSTHCAASIRFASFCIVLGHANSLPCIVHPLQ